MKHSTKPVFLCLFAVLFSGCLPQSAFKVAVKVIDEETGKPIPDALVFIEARAKAEPPREEPFDQAVVTAWGRTNSAGIARLRKVQGFHWGQEPQNQLWKMLESRKPQVKRIIASIDGGSVLVFAREYGALHHPFGLVDNPAFQERIKEGKYAGWMGKWGFKGEDRLLELNTKDLKAGKEFVLKMKKPESSTYLAACFSIYGLATIWPATSRKTGMAEKQQEQVYDYFVDSILPTASVPVDKSIQDLLHPETRQWFINPEHLLGPATNHDTIIHNWLTQKAVEQLPAGYEEVKQYLQIIQAGVKDEDALSRPLKHFYNPFDPDSAMTGGESALKWGAIGQPDNPNNEWDYADAVRYYQQGDREKAYKALGHVLHLLEDLSVPMHTHIIPHEYTLMPQAAVFETYFENMIKQNANSLPPEYSQNAKEAKAAGGLSDQFDAVAKLTFGEVEEEGQKFNFEDYYSWIPNSIGGLIKNPDPEVLQLMGKYLFPKAIGSGTALMKRFYDTLHPELSAQATQGKEATDAGEAKEKGEAIKLINSSTLGFFNKEGRLLKKISLAEEKGSVKVKLNNKTETEEKRTIHKIPIVSKNAKHAIVNSETYIPVSDCEKFGCLGIVEASKIALYGVDGKQVYEKSYPEMMGIPEPEKQIVISDTGITAVIIESGMDRPGGYWTKLYVYDKSGKIILTYPEDKTNIRNISTQNLKISLNGRYLAICVGFLDPNTVVTVFFDLKTKKSWKAAHSYVIYEITDNGLVECDYYDSEKKEPSITEFLDIKPYLGK